MDSFGNNMTNGVEDAEKFVVKMYCESSNVVTTDELQYKTRELAPNQ